MILTNLIFVTACTLLLGLQKALYGPLRPIEVEQLYEKAWFAITETCLAMTIFRGEIGAWFLIMFFALLTGKVWGWIGEGRVEILEQQPPRNPRLFHTRLALSLGLSVFFDLTMIEYVVKQVMHMARPDMTVMFGFEFAVLSITSLSTAAKYAINLVEIGIVREQKKKRAEEIKKERLDTAKRNVEAAESRSSQGAVDSTTHSEATQELLAETPPPPSIDEAREALRRAEDPVDELEVEVEGWDGKGRWVFYLDLATDFFKLVVYLSFFVILLVFYGLPIHIMRDVFLTARSFLKRISDFVKYRTATRDMNARYPDASDEDIGREDVCIICREEMRPYQPPAEGQQQPNPVMERMRPKKLPCGHVLHFACLRSWLERQQVCPTCRRPVIQGAQATGPVALPGAQGAQGQHPPAERPGPRIFQLGPIRIGVGAARGNNMFEDLQNQMADGRPQPLQRVDQDGPQQYGFGIRWDARRRHHRRHQPASARDQLDAIGQQLQQDSQTLLNNTQEYATLRNMQAELDRIRAQRAGGADQLQGAPASRPAPDGTNQQIPLLGAPAPQHSLPGFRTFTNLHSMPGEQVLQAGSEQLPAGLTLPDGWSMLPLQPSGPPMTQMPLPHGQGPQMMPQPMGQQFQAHFQGPMPVPDHIRAMFANMPGQQNTAQSSNQVQTADVRGQNSSVQHPAQGQNQQLPVGGPGDLFNLMRAQMNGPMPNGSPANMGNGDLQRQSEGPAAHGVMNGAAEGYAQNVGASTLAESASVPRASAQRPREGTEANFEVFSQTSQAQTGTTASAQTLPSWGSDLISAPPASNEVTQTAFVPPTTNGDHSMTSESSPKRPKPASVEDLVEDPD